MIAPFNSDNGFVILSRISQTNMTSLYPTVNYGGFFFDLGSVPSFIFSRILRTNMDIIHPHPEVYHEVVVDWPRAAVMITTEGTSASQLIGVNHFEIYSHQLYDYQQQLEQTNAIYRRFVQVPFHLDDELYEMIGNDRQSDAIPHEILFSVTSAGSFNELSITGSQILN